MAGDARRLAREKDAGLLLKDPQHGDGARHDRGLRILGEGERIVRSFEHDRRQLLAERVVDFLEHLAGRRARVRQGLSHAHRLAALTRKDERARHI